MLRKSFNFVFSKQFPKCLSTISEPKVEYDSHNDSNDLMKETEILQHPDYFNVHNLFTVKDLFNARVHYGHKVSSLENNMKPFVFGSRLGHVIFDLDLTAYHLCQALNFTAHIAYRDGIILFISQNPQMTLLVEDYAQKCGEYAVTRTWKLGLFTDSLHLFKTHIRFPDLCIFLNTLEENGKAHLGVSEAAKMCIPSIGIVDSNCHPNLITYPVPGNDDSYSCFKLYCELFSKAILRGKAERKKRASEILKESEKENIVENTTNQSIIGKSYENSKVDNTDSEKV